MKLYDVLNSKIYLKRKALLFTVGAKSMSPVDNDLLFVILYTACQNYMQINIFAQTRIVFNKNSRNVARYMATLTHAQI